ncbi:unnamed protein product, partial [Scytosiphon promiscuus]
VTYAARDVAVAAGGEGSGAGRFDEAAIVPFRFSETRVDGLPDDLAPPCSAPAAPAESAAGVAVAGNSMNGTSGGGGGGGSGGGGGGASFYEAGD